MSKLACLILAVICVFRVAAVDIWTNTALKCWSRDPGTLAAAPSGAVWNVRSSGSNSWSLSGFRRIPVKPGERFVFSCSAGLAAESAPSDDRRLNLAIVLTDGKGAALDWAYAQRTCRIGPAAAPFSTSFIVPPGAAALEPRVTGFGPDAFRLSGLELRRVGFLDFAAVHPIPSATLGSGPVSLTVSAADGSFAVRDSRTGRTWAPAPSAAPRYQLVTSLAAASNTVTLTRLLLDRDDSVTATWTLVPDAPEVVFTLSGSGVMPGSMNFPAPFATAPGDRLIVPMNEGMGFPVDEPHEGLGHLIAYGGHGICMAFFGVAEDLTGAGWMCILETADDAALNAARVDNLWTAGPSWDPQKGMFGYTRRARYVFFARGGHVAMCQRYRAYVRSLGRLKTFTEKAKENPDIDLLLGAANIWTRNIHNRTNLVAEMRARGMTNLLWSAGGSAEEIRVLRAIPRVLVGRYDIYQDIMDPARYKDLRYHPHTDWVPEAFPQDINWAGPSAADWRRGWKVAGKNGTLIPCATICDARALPYAERRIAAELKVKPYAARFIDTTVASPWQECYNPAHPMTRSESRVWKMRLLDLVKSHGLVCGSETGHDASVPFCDYFEGMMSVAPYRAPDCGRFVDLILTNVPPRTAKYMVGERYRLPLWELVYHDCVVAYWYWGDFNNKMDAIWAKRDLFNALYGTPPLYFFNDAFWRAHKDRIAASYQVAEPVSRLTAYAAMTDHLFLKADRSVQQTRFSNGVVVTVNFGDAPFTLPDGFLLPPMSRHVETAPVPAR